MLVIDNMITGLMRYASRPQYPLLPLSSNSQPQQNCWCTLPPNRHLLGCMRDSLIKCRSGHGRRHKPNYSTYLQHNMCYSILLCTADNLTTSMVIPRGLRRSVSNFKGFKYKSIWNSSVYGSPTRSHSRLASSASSFYFTCPVDHSSTPSNQPADRPTNHPQHANVEI